MPNSLAAMAVLGQSAGVTISRLLTIGESRQYCRFHVGIAQSEVRSHTI
ncbi:hypothetical protein [Microcoleus sp. S13C4]